MKDLYARVIEQVRATHHTRLDDSEGRATHSEAEDIIRGWDTVELLYNIFGVGRHVPGATVMTTPNMHNFTNDYLADEIGTQDAIAKEATARLNALKEEAKRRGIESAQGRHWRISDHRRAKDARRQGPARTFRRCAG